MGMETGAKGLESLIACLVVTLDFDGHHPILLLDDVVHLVIAIAPIEYAIIICEGVADDVRADGRLEIGAPRFWVCDRRLEGLIREYRAQGIIIHLKLGCAGAFACFVEGNFLNAHEHSCRGEQLEITGQASWSATILAKNRLRLVRRFGEEGLV